MFRKSISSINEFRNALKQIAKRHDNCEVKFGELTGLLAEHNIKFFSREEVSKINKLFPSTFHSLPLSSIFSYFELACVQVMLEIKIFVVKVKGRALEKSQIKEKDIQKESHHIHECLKALRERLTKIKQKDSFWFRALGGISNTNTLKQCHLRSRVYQMLKNSPHSGCLARIIKHLGGDEDDEEREIPWEYVRRRLQPALLMSKEIFSQVQNSKWPNSKILKSKSAGEKGLESMRITTFHSLDSIRLDPVCLPRQNPQLNETRCMYRTMARSLQYSQILERKNRESPEGRTEGRSLKKMSIATEGEERQTIIHSNLLMHERMFRRERFKSKSTHQ